MNTEARPKNITKIGCVKVTHDGFSRHPFGWIDYFTTCPTGWLALDGTFKCVESHRDLYAMIGDRYCPPTITETLPMPVWKAALTLFGFRFPPAIRRIANPDYRPGFFRLPDLRSRTI